MVRRPLPSISPAVVCLISWFVRVGLGDTLQEPKLEGSGLGPCPVIGVDIGVLTLRVLLPQSCYSNFDCFVPVLFHLAVTLS